MKISKSVKVVAGIALFAPLVMYATDTNLMSIAASELKSQFITPDTKTAAYSIAGLGGIIGYITTHDHRAWYALGGVAVGLAVVFKLVTGSAF